MFTPLSEFLQFIERVSIKSLFRFDTKIGSVESRSRKFVLRYDMTGINL